VPSCYGLLRIRSLTALGLRLFNATFLVTYLLTYLKLFKRTPKLSLAVQLLVLVNLQQLNGRRLNLSIICTHPIGR
jgi:hypothetical protein